MKFYICNANGEILRSGTCPTSMLALQMGVDEYVLEGEADDTTQWVDTDTWALKDRPAMLLGVSDTTITGIPAGAIVTVKGQQHQVDDGEVELEFDMPGKHRVRIECFPYLPAELEIEA